MLQTPSTNSTYRKVAAEEYARLISVSGLMGPSHQILDPLAQESDSIQDLQGLNITFLPRQSNFTQLHPVISALRHALGSCLQHHSTCPFISLAVFTNFQSSVSLLNSSNTHAPNAVWTIWLSNAAYLIWPNCYFFWISSIGSLATAIYVPMRLTCGPASLDRRRHPILLPAPRLACQCVRVTLSTLQGGALST